MSTRKLSLAGCLLASVMMIGAAAAQETSTHYGLGSPVTQDELAGYFSIQPDGRTLPPGSGKGTDGARIYAESCAACHGEKLEGNPAKGIGGDKLIGGRGSLASKTPVKTVESYWPYSTTLFDYVKRAMPFSAPGSLSDNDVYAVVAYILSEAKIIKPTDVMDAKTLPKVAMPNKDGFIADSRPELELYR
ncbi:MAG TPA: cytochrome c [Xanthobacteraceae bacterium]|jgi:cytochrome c|nr:cytochrome c [Xanthobacteraceae bacterium]